MTLPFHSFVTGYGQHDTKADTGQQYEKISWAQIVAMIQHPPRSEKSEAQWIIPSTYADHDARSHDAQRERGRFMALAIDIDTGSPDLKTVKTAMRSVADAFLIYSTSSATPGAMKWRGIIPLRNALAGADYTATQTALFDILADHNITCDRALNRPGQLVYLPNRGEHYEHHIEPGQPLTLAQSTIAARMDESDELSSQIMAEVKAARERRQAQRKAKMRDDDFSPVDHFNAAHSIADLFARYGYERQGSSDHWRSPMQTTKSFATRDYGEHWVSLSSSDAGADIGATTVSGATHGDAFDLFVHFDHGGDFHSAVASYGAEVNPPAHPFAPADDGVDLSQFGKPKVVTMPMASAIDDPVDLLSGVAIPPMPQDVLPTIIEQFGLAIGEQLGTDPAAVQMAALGVCAGAIPDRIKLKMTRHGAWTECARLWVCLVGDPSNKKSPVMAAASRPMRDIDFEMMKANEKANSDWLAIPKNERPAQPQPTRVCLGDATIEAAQGIFKANKQGLLSIQDEMSGWFGKMEKGGGSVDRAFWLESYNGSSYVVNRVGRGEVFIENLSMSLVGGIQPEPIRKIGNEGGDDGLMQRIIPVIMRKPRLSRDVPMPPVASNYDEMVKRLRNDLRVENMIEANNPLTFSDRAQQVFEEQQANFYHMQQAHDLPLKLQSHYGKYEGLYGRLCVVMHCIEHAMDEYLPTQISHTTAARVARLIIEYIKPSAEAFHSDILGLGDTHETIQKIARMILARGLTEISPRDVQRSTKALRKLSSFEIAPILQTMEAMGWLGQLPQQRLNSLKYAVNPAVHEVFAAEAEEEKRRYEEAKAAVKRELGAK